jgi:hypothetical protein
MEPPKRNKMAAASKRRRPPQRVQPLLLSECGRPFRFRENPIAVPHGKYSFRGGGSEDACKFKARKSYHTFRKMIMRMFIMENG